MKKDASRKAEVSRLVAGRSATRWRWLIGLVGVVCATPAAAATVQRAPFGTLPDGTVVEAVTLTGSNRVSARIITYGATLQALNVPDRTGKVADVTLGYDDLKSLVEKPNYFGATIGRYANRIAGGRFTLDGKTLPDHRSTTRPTRCTAARAASTRRCGGSRRSSRVRRRASPWC